MTELKPEFKKWLTKEILGECWHTVTGICWKCKKYIGLPYSRSFTTWQDYGDVVTALQLSSKYNFEEILSWMMNNYFRYLSETPNVNNFFSALQEWLEKEGK